MRQYGGGLIACPQGTFSSSDIHDAQVVFLHLVCFIVAVCGGALLSLFSSLLIWAQINLGMPSVTGDVMALKH